MQIVFSIEQSADSTGSTNVPLVIATDSNLNQDPELIKNAILNVEFSQVNDSLENIVDLTLMNEMQKNPTPERGEIKNSDSI